MVGANPKFQTSDHVGQVMPPGAMRRAWTQVAQHGAASYRWRWIAVLSALVAISLVLVQYGKAPNAGVLPPIPDFRRFVSTIGSPAPQFNDRFPSASERFVEYQSSDAPSKRMAEAELAPLQVASLAPTVPYRVPPEKQPRWSASNPRHFLSRQQSAHRRAVPQRFQGRPPRPSRSGRQGFLAGRDLQR